MLSQTYYYLKKESKTYYSLTELKVLWKLYTSARTNSMFVSAELAYKPWLKVPLAGLVWEKNTIQTMNYKPDTSNPAETN